MRKLLLALAGSLLFVGLSTAQQTDAAVNSKPTKEDIEKYYSAMHVREMMKSMMDAMSKQMRQMSAEQLKKHVPDVTPEMQAKMDHMLDDIMKNIDTDGLLQAMTPVYQRHLTKADLNALVAFYSSPTGQRILREMPAITQEAMQAASGIMQKQMDVAMEKAEQLAAEIEKDSKARSN
jgi:hypothetical protein